MATWTGSIELRKLVVRLTRGPSGGTQEDTAQMTFHFLNLTGGSPDSTWTSTDYGQVEARWDTFWGAIKIFYPASTSLNEYRWFKSGPVWDPEGDAPYNPADRTTTRAVPGTSSVANGMLPPQCAISVTEKTEIRKRWGRFYMPAPALSSIVQTKVVSSEGRVPTTTGDIGQVLHASAVAMYNGCRADEIIPVVWSKARAAYTTEKDHDIPAHVATAYSVDSLQVDNLYDVIRSRRYDGPTVRLSTVLT